MQNCKHLGWATLYQAVFLLCPAGNSDASLRLNACLVRLLFVFGGGGECGKVLSSGTNYLHSISGGDPTTRVNCFVGHKAKRVLHCLQDM